jgi:hypothetical protein
MTKLGATIAALVSAALIAGAAPMHAASAQQTAVVAAPPAAKPRITLTRAFDGLWSVSIATINGSCPASLRYPAIISNGLVGRAGGEYGYDISGAVYNTGGIIVTVSQSGQSAMGRGRLTRLRGGGTWRAESGQCSGTWVAERRG